MPITKDDSNLINRAVRHIRAAAKSELDTYGPNWGRNAETKKSKRRYDRLKRDERDLSMLCKRLTEESVQRFISYSDAINDNPTHVDGIPTQ